MKYIMAAIVGVILFLSGMFVGFINEFRVSLPLYDAHRGMSQLLTTCQANLEVARKTINDGRYDPEPHACISVCIEEFQKYGC